MTTRGRERLYHLLPQIYRQRDAANGYPLRALLAVIEEEFIRLETDIDAAYDDWFIETSNSWVIPYLADLVGITDVSDLEYPYFRQRRRVANHIAYERRKGGLGVLAHVVRDVTEWPAYGVESARLVARTIQLNDDPDSAPRTFATGPAGRAALVNTPFDTQARTVDVGGLGAGHGHARYGVAALGSIALYLWRLHSLPLHRAEAGVPEGAGDALTHHFHFDPLGRDLPLFIIPDAIDDLDTPLRPMHAPHPISRALLCADLARAGSAPTSDMVGPTRSLAIWVRARPAPAQTATGGAPGAQERAQERALPWRYVRPSEMACGVLDDINVSLWQARLERSERQVVIDPERGRLLFAEPHVPGDVHVRYAYGSSSELGSGPMPRASHAGDHLLRVARESSETEARDTFPTLTAALRRWREICVAADADAPPSATIRLLDSGIYDEGTLEIVMPTGSRLTLEAMSGQRPLVRTPRLTILPAEKKIDLLVPVEKAEELEAADQTLTLSGLFLDGPLYLTEVERGRFALAIEQCTLRHPLDVTVTREQRIDLLIQDSLLGPVRVSCQNGSGSCTIHDSVLDGGALDPDDARAALEVGGARVATTITRATLFGDVTVGQLAGLKDSLLIGTLRTALDEKKEGIVQYSYLAAHTLAEGAPRHCLSGPEAQPRVDARHPGSPTYARLAPGTPASIRYGASDGGEMGALNRSYHFRRQQNLSRILDNYIPLGHAPGIFYVT